MLGASQLPGNNRSRHLRSEEKDLIRKALGSWIDVDLNNLKVLDAGDGGMGGIRFVSDGPSKRVFGSELARLGYIDADGVPVSITLSSDSNGDLFEIDFWKVDFSPLVIYPKSDQLEKGDPQGR